MRPKNAMNGQVRALAIALAGAAATAVAAMFVPTAIYETITGSTGISEVFPSTKAPLGDTARAMIAFATAALSFALLAAFLLRQNAAPVAKAAPSVSTASAAPIVQLNAEDDADPKPSVFDVIKKKIADFAEARRSGSDGIKDLADLPKLRAEDAHPDAPPRRPISAHRDFGEPAMAAKVEAVEAPAPAAEIATVSEAVVPEAVADVVAPSTPVIEAAPEVKVEGGFVSVVERLEQAVAQRQSKLDELDRIAREIVTSDAAVAPTPAPIQSAEPVVEPVAPIRPQPFLSSIDGAKSAPAPTKSGDDMDAALRSALETLHKMNARNR